MEPVIGYKPTLIERANHIFRRSTAIFRKNQPSMLVQHGKRELLAIGMDPDDKEDGPNKWMASNILELLQVFAAQGHSGSSAPYVVNLFEKLARFEPLGPLTGADSEWTDHGDGLFQNKRCSRVFKQPDRFDGQAYDLYGKGFRDPAGVSYTNRESMTPIIFPYTPTTVYF